MLSKNMFENSFIIKAKTEAISLDSISGPNLVHFSFLAPFSFRAIINFIWIH